jgi:hypothetical protein
MGGLIRATIVQSDRDHFFGFADGTFFAWLKSDPATDFWAGVLFLFAGAVTLKW